MVNCRLIERLYESASIRRWNDFVRPVEFTELDKQSHKMLIAFVIAKFEPFTQPDDGIDWLRLVEGGIFEFLQRIILTDIKPPVFHKMMREKGDELNEWVLERLGPEIAGVKGGFDERFRRYLFDDSYARLEKRILKAAHYMATQWEFNIIYKVCPFGHDIEKVKGEIEGQLEDFYDLHGVQRVMLGSKVSGFVSLCGQLRFQRRWAQSHRVPETAVLGHMLIVALTTYLCLREVDACDERICHGFYAGLFHDLPEVLTRDITSTIKGAVEGLADIIREYERKQVEEKLLPLLPEDWHADMNYFMEDEFENRVMIDGEVISGVSFEDMQAKYNLPEFKAIDGKLIRACDHLAAFIEASLSIQHGIRSRPLEEGVERLLEKYRNSVVSTINFGDIFESFNVAE